MVKILLITLLIFTFQSKSFSNNEVTKFDDLVQRNNVFFKKFSNEPFTGRVSDKTYEGYIKDGNVEGKWVEFYKNGKPKVIGNWRNGSGNGEFFWYSESGYKTEKRTFTNGELIGDVIYYWKGNNQGEIWKKIPTRNGEVHGNSLTFHPNGNLWSEKQHVDGKQHGVQKDYFENGELERIFYFFKGKQHGSYKSYYENGKPEIIGNFKNDKRHGKYEFFDKKGKIKKDSGFYKDGKKVNE